MLAKSKLNSVENLICQALTDMEISHEEVMRVLKEKDKYEIMNDNLRSENEKYMSNDTTYKIMRLSSTCLKETSCKQRIK